MSEDTAVTLEPQTDAGAAGAARPFALYQFLCWDERNPYKSVVTVPDAHVAFRQVVESLPPEPKKPGRPARVTLASQVRRAVHALDSPQAEFLEGCRRALCLPGYLPNNLLGPKDEYVARQAKEFVQWYANKFPEE